jgi:hypothetical protein
MMKILISCLFTSLLIGCNSSNFSTVQAYGCNDKVEWNVCNGKPTYLGEIQLIISKEGKSIKMTQRQAKGNPFFTEGTFTLTNCVITDANNWSCKEKSPYGELYFVNEMIDGYFFSSNTSEFIKGSGLSYTGYQGIKGLLIKYGVWNPSDHFKTGKKED